MLWLWQLQKYQPALPRSRNMSMMGLNDSASTVLAWEQALGSLKKSLPSKDLKRLQLPVSPADLVSHVEAWLASKPGKAKKAVNVMGQTVSRIQRFSSCVDQLAQGSPAPATLLWGSIKFILTVCSNVLPKHSHTETAFRSFKTSQKSTKKFVTRWQYFLTRYPGSIYMQTPSLSPI